MQALRRSLTNISQRPAILVQSIRFDGSDPRSSTSSEKHKGMQQSGSARGSDLNKSKGGEKKQKSTVTDDTKQPGTTRKDWNQPNKVVGNDPRYGKAGGSADT
ncbi:hypothetical protein I4U23_008417 [Adineta vaga]|nr:hypothetical protein I4U23_008417 [Adineta vaga]